MKNIIRSIKGFTIVELIMVVTIIATLSVIAIPTFIQWREGSQYREMAKSIFFMMRDARSRAIETNRQHLIEIDMANNRCRMLRGNAPSNSGIWANLGDWSTAPQPVLLNAAANSVTFNPNGAVISPLSIDIRDLGAANRWWVEIDKSGRVRVDKVM